MVGGEPLAGLSGHLGLVLALANHLQQEENPGETPGIEGLFKNIASQCNPSTLSSLLGLQVMSLLMPALVTVILSWKREMVSLKKANPFCITCKTKKFHSVSNCADKSQ